MSFIFILNTGMDEEATSTATRYACTSFAGPCKGGTTAKPEKDSSPSWRWTISISLFWRRSKGVTGSRRRPITRFTAVVYSALEIVTAFFIGRGACA